MVTGPPVITCHSISARSGSADASSTDARVATGRSTVIGTQQVSASAPPLSVRIRQALVGPAFAVSGSRMVNGRFALPPAGTTTVGVTTVGQPRLLLTDTA